jgi:hypothetical protein
MLHQSDTKIGHRKFIIPPVKPIYNYSTPGIRSSNISNFSKAYRFIHNKQKFRICHPAS